MKARMRSVPERDIMLTFSKPSSNSIAAVARIAGEEKYLVGLKPYRLGTRKQICR